MSFLCVRRKALHLFGQTECSDQDVSDTEHWHSDCAHVWIAFGYRNRISYGATLPASIGNVLLLVLNLPLVGLWVQVLKIPTPYLYAGILLFATIGTYGIGQSVFDLALLYAIGIVGFFMRRYDFPTSPVIIGMILGPFAEQQVRRAMTISQGDMTVFFTRPNSATLITLSVLALVVPLVLVLLRNRKASAIET
ncbi:hypothetical protein GCM10011491_23460 [Brucella endophytica]|uniref:DUF112 domain-containing protein n=1 Tax=Brucella endophytica TaxID=1963359 RepID=A0A916WG74_9HYPH|nr:hypothetical protein GCM10011491_23460 [Brucella endophytica]